MQTFEFHLVRISYGLPIMAVCLDRMTHTKVIGKKITVERRMGVVGQQLDDTMRW